MCMKLKVMALAFVTALAVTGCVRIDETISCTELNEVAVNTKSYVRTDTYDEILEDGGKFTLLGEDFYPEGIEVIGDTEYYFQNQSGILTEKEFSKEWYFAVLTKESFYGDLSNGVFSSAKLSENGIDDTETVLNETVKECLDGYKLTVKFDHEVMETNGKADGNSVVFEYDPEHLDDEWYAYTDNAIHTLIGDRKIIAARLDEKSVDKIKPIIRLVKSKSNDSKVYVLVKDNKKLKKVVINGKKYTTLKKRKLTSGNYKDYYSFSSTKKGKNTVAAYDASGNVKKVRFTIR